MNQKQFQLMRSLYRYIELKEMKSADVVIENEERILSKRIKSLTPEDLSLIVTSWNNFYKDQMTQDQTGLDRFLAEVEKEMRSLN